MPGVLRSGFREISQGIKAGDKVVAVGMQKIRLGKNPVTGEDFLVKARPFDPEKDSSTRPVARPAADSAGGQPSPPPLGRRKIAHRGLHGGTRRPGRRQPRQHAKTVLPELWLSPCPPDNSRRS